MPYNPKDLLVLKAEIQINGVWTTITSRTRSAGKVWIKHGMSDGASGPETSRMRCLLGNDDGWLTEGNPSSPWFPYIGRGTPIRLSVTGVLAVDAGRFAGEIDRMEAIYPGGDNSVMYVEAIGTGGTLAQSDEEIRSPMYRTISGVSAEDYLPHAYWPMEDGPDSTKAAAATAGRSAATVAGGVSFAADSDLVGSQPLPTLAAGAVISGTIPSYTSADQWFLQVALRINGEPAGDTTYLEIDTPGGDNVLWRLYVEPGSPSILWFIGLDGAGAPTGAGTGVLLTGDSSNNPSEAAFYGRWWFYTLYTYVGPLDDLVYGGMFITDNGEFSNFGAGASTDTVFAAATGWRLYGGNGTAAGHVAFFTDPAFSPAAAFDNAVAMGGHAAETVEARIARLAREEGLTVTVVGHSAHQMGPQRAAKLTTLFADCQAVDQGMWSDDRSDIGLVYRTGSNLYTQAAQIAVARGSLTPDTRPVWDYQHVRNEWTVSRVNGSSSTQSDEAHVARVRRRLKGSATVNVYSDDVLDGQAQWRVNVTTALGPRYSSLGINLRNQDGAQLADAVLETETGDRMTVAAEAFPGQHPPGGADQLIGGWEEDLDADVWEFRPVVTPYSPYDVVGRWALLSHELHAAVSSSPTGIDIANTDVTQPMLATAAADIGSGYGVTIGAEEMQLTAVAASVATFGTAGTASTGASGSRTPGLPTSSASGNLVLIYASTRNSGTGVPDTPADWDRLPIFPAAANCQVFGRIYDGVWSMPTVTFTGGAANEDTIAQSMRLAGKWHSVANILVGSASCLNASAANITYPGLPKPICDDAIIVFFAWKQDDFTSIVGPGTEIQEASSAAGNDASQSWAYTIQTTADSVASGVFTPAGGASAISRGAVAAIRCDYQTATVTRSTNGVSASHSAGDAVTMTKPMRWGLV